MYFVILHNKCPFCSGSLSQSQGYINHLVTLLAALAEEVLTVPKEYVEDPSQPFAGWMTKPAEILRAGSCTHPSPNTHTPPHPCTHLTYMHPPKPQHPPTCTYHNL